MRWRSSRSFVEDGGSGIQLRLQADFTPDGSRVHLRLEGQKAKLLERRRVSSSYPVLTLTTRGGATPHTAKQEVKLSLPTQESVRWDIHRTLPIGRWSILYTDAEAGDSVQLLVGRVRAN